MAGGVHQGVAGLLFLFGAGQHRKGYFWTGQRRTLANRLGRRTGIRGQAILVDQAFFFQAIITTFGERLALWRAVTTLGSDVLAEYRVAGFDLRCSRVGGWQSKGSAG